MKKKYIKCSNPKCKNGIDVENLETDEYLWKTSREIFCSLECYKIIDKKTYRKKIDELEHRIFGIDVDDRNGDYYEDV